MSLHVIAALAHEEAVKAPFRKSDAGDVTICQVVMSTATLMKVNAPGARRKNPSMTSCAVLGLLRWCRSSNWRGVCNSSHDLIILSRWAVSLRLPSLTATLLAGPEQRQGPVRFMCRMDLVCLHNG